MWNPVPGARCEHARPVAHETQSFTFPFPRVQCQTMEATLSMEALLQSNLPYKLKRGKVRDVYDLGDALLIIASDRISAFDVVLPNGIPGKGKILTALSVFWFKRFEHEIEN